jgi:carbonic anhydrase/acetyltransferase-like protein (isoleucine patch superfamily)
MIVRHDGYEPQIHPTAYVAPTAVICGNVTIGADARMLFGAVLTAESGPGDGGRAGDRHGTGRASRNASAAARHRR